MRMTPWLALLLACGGKGDEYSEDTAPFTSGGGGIVPVAGTWQVDDFRALTDPCGLFFEGDPTAYFSSEWTVTPTSGGFDLEDSAGAFSFSCTVSGTSFSCDEEESTTPVGYGLTADLIYTTTVSGVLKSETAISAKPKLELSCEGPDCVQVETAIGLGLPCSLGMSAEMSAGG